MRQRPTARRWWTLLILGLLGTWADPGPRAAAGSTCHAPDRPILGLDLDGDAAAGGDLRPAPPADDPAGGPAATGATPARYRPAPCEADRGGRPDRLSASGLPAGPMLALSPRPSTPPLLAEVEESARPRDGGGRLERPPRRI